MRTSLRSGLFVTTSLRRMSRKSVCKSRSCTSSRITTLYRASIGSVVTRFRSVPTVQNSIVPVSAVGKIVSPRTAWPTSLPHSSWYLSHATRCASDTAAIRRGCVTTIRGLFRVQAGRLARTRVATSMSSSSSSPSKYLAEMVFWSSETAKTSQAYHVSSPSSSWYSHSTTAPSSRVRGSSSPPSCSQSRQSSRMNWGIWVDLPLPVPPETIMTWLRSRAALISSRISSAGSLPLISSRRQSSSSGFVTS
mmetsp:Transcript_92464/g.239401  ORF Transcript_92464/g.239401 Transcript_92464/m.239401 type:complete len:250 (-) Transcript_92464:1033-1782(-)